MVEGGSQARGTMCMARKLSTVGLRGSRETTRVLGSSTAAVGVRGVVGGGEKEDSCTCIVRHNHITLSCLLPTIFRS
jgi:hypothetical protein